MPSATAPQGEPLQVAIIGAGIAGLTLALGLLPRKIPFTIYERAPSFREIGAGIGFSPNSERAMGSLSPETLSAFKNAANPNGEDYFQWAYGYGEDKLLFKLHVGKDGFQGSRRSDILEAWAKLIPSAKIQFGKELSTVTDNLSSGPVQLTFKDGTSATASAVIGCDGIRSRVRHHVLSPPDKLESQIPPPLSINPGYTQKFCFRSLVPMPQAISSIGEYKASRRFMYNGPGAHVITYPVAFNTFLNVLVVISDPNPTWPPSHSCESSTSSSHSHTLPNCPKSEAVSAFRGWNQTVRSIIDLLPDTLEKWAIFDMADHPAPTYTKGRVALAGDAAHATGPHLGSGGGLGVEDALCLSGLLEAVKQQQQQQQLESGNGNEAGLVEKALAAYNHVRYERTQWVVRATREAVDLFHWTNPKGKDPTEFGKEITKRFHKIWLYDVDEMVHVAVNEFKKQ